MPEATTWLIKRNCSASPRQLAAVLLSLVAVSFGFGVGFAFFGLWLVLPFVGLELLAVAIAFFCYGRHAADFERIVLADGHLSVERVDAQKHQEFVFDLPWVRVEIFEQGMALGTRVRVELVAGGRRIDVGRHLLDGGRKVLARELTAALHAAPTHSAA